MDTLEWHRANDLTEQLVIETLLMDDDPHFLSIVFTLYVDLHEMKPIELGAWSLDKRGGPKRGKDLTEQLSERHCSKHMEQQCKVS